MTYAIRVTYQDGAEVFVRHGPVVGEGPIVRYRSRVQAEEALGFLAGGLEPEGAMRVVEWRAAFE